MLRKRVKDLETEYKQLQRESQVKESRLLDLESDLEVLFFLNSLSEVLLLGLVDVVTYIFSHLFLFACSVVVSWMLNVCVVWFLQAVVSCGV